VTANTITSAIATSAWTAPLMTPSCDRNNTIVVHGYFRGPNAVPQLPDKPAAGSRLARPGRRSAVCLFLLIDR
jgi:hypothetical protein